MGFSDLYPNYTDEMRLQELLATKVEGARVVHIAGQGFWALIPHYPFAPSYRHHATLGAHYLGETYGKARQMLFHCWGIPTED